MYLRIPFKLARGITKHGELAHGSIRIARSGFVQNNSSVKSIRVSHMPTDLVLFKDG